MEHRYSIKIKSILRGFFSSATTHQYKHIHINFAIQNAFCRITQLSKLHFFHNFTEIFFPVDDFFCEQFFFSFTYRLLCMFVWHCGCWCCRIGFFSLSPSLLLSPLNFFVESKIVSNLNYLWFFSCVICTWFALVTTLH